MRPPPLTSTSSCATTSRISAVRWREASTISELVRASVMMRTSAMARARRGWTPACPGRRARVGRLAARGPAPTALTSAPKISDSCCASVVASACWSAITESSSLKVSTSIERTIERMREMLVAASVRITVLVGA
jgi:hypothetical protein